MAQTKGAFPFTITATKDSLSDTVTIFKVQGGTDGAAGAQGVQVLKVLVVQMVQMVLVH